MDICGPDFLMPLALVILIIGIYIFMRGHRRQIPIISNLGKGFIIAALILWFRSIQYSTGPILEDEFGLTASVIIVASIGIVFAVLVWLILFYPKKHPFGPKLFTVHCMDCGEPFEIKSKEIETKVRCEKCEKKRHL